MIGYKINQQHREVEEVTDRQEVRREQKILEP